MHVAVIFVRNNSFHMHLLSPQLEKYIEDHCTDEDAVSAKLNRFTHLNVLMPQMLSGKVQGQVLSMLSFMLRPRRVLEIGTFTGYAAIALAKGLPEDGLLHTIEVNPEQEVGIRKHVKEAGMDEKIKLHIGKAAEIIPTMEEQFDLVFIDADKQNYALYYDLVFDKVRAGGFIIADNVLWSGKVVEDKKDKDTLAIDAFNKKVNEDTRVDNVIASVRDGLLLIRKR